MWTITAPQLEIPSDPFNSDESKSYEIRKRAPQSIHVFITTDYRLHIHTIDLQIYNFISHIDIGLEPNLAIQG